MWQRLGTFRADGVTPTTYADTATDWANTNIQFNTLNGSFYWPTLGEVRGKMVMWWNPDPIFDWYTGLCAGLTYVGHNLSQFSTYWPPGGEFAMSTRDQYNHHNYGDKQSNDIKHIGLASEDKSKTHLYVTGLNIAFVGAGNYPYTHAEAMNGYLLSQLNNMFAPGYLKKTGIVLMDFPGPGLLDSIVALNFRHKANAASVYPSFYQYASHLPLQTNVYDQYNSVATARAWRRLVKERIPSTEFNTVVVKSEKFFSFSHTVSTNNPTDLSTAVGPFRDDDVNRETFGVLFQSHRLPPAYTSNQVYNFLVSNILANNLNVTNLKASFDAQFPGNQWTVINYFCSVSNIVPVAHMDFDSNVVAAVTGTTINNIFAQWIVAGYRKPDMVCTQESTRSVVGQWEFPYPQWTNALVGSNLTAISTDVSPSASEHIYLSRGTPGIKMSTGSAPNGGPSAIRLHQWTLVMDIYAWPFNQNGTLISLLQVDSLDNSTDGEVFIRQLVDPYSGTQTIEIGTKGNYFGPISNGLRRVVVAVDATQDQLMSFYIDGNKVGELTSRTFEATGILATGFTYSGQDRWSLSDQAILFGDNNGESGGLVVGGVQLRNYKMSDAEVAKLGGVSTTMDRIPNDDKKVFIDLEGRQELQVVNPTNGFVRMRNVPNQPRITWKPDDVLQSANTITGTFSDVTGTGILDVPGEVRRRVYYPPENSTKFFRVE